MNIKIMHIPTDQRCTSLVHWIQLSDKKERKKVDDMITATLLTWLAADLGQKVRRPGDSVFDVIAISRVILGGGKGRRRDERQSGLVLLP